MIKKLYLPLVALLVLALSSCGKMGELSSDYFTTNPEVLEAIGGKVPVTINGKFPEKYFKKNATVEVTPVLRWKGGEAKGQPAVFQGEKVEGNNQTIAYKAGGSYTMKASFDYVPEMANSELYLDFKITKGKKSYTIPSVKIADGVIATSELPTAASSNASYANDAFQRIIKDAQTANIMFLIQQANVRAGELKTAKEFNERLDFNGVVLTKLDGDTRGGAALSIRSVVNKPIKFVGTGEKLDAIDQFHPSRMADRILGMGDIVSLVERAQEQYDEEEAKRLQKKIAKNQFDFNDFISQIQQIKKMGNLKELASMIPGVGKALKDVDIDDNAFKSIEAIIQSMTPTERSHPEVLNSSRRQRIARGSGTSIQEVNRLIKQFDDMRKMMRMMTQGKNPARMMGQLKRR